MKKSIAFLFALITTIGSCAVAADRQEAAKESSDYTIHLPGIAGARSLDQRFLRGLQEGGYEGTLKIFDWTDHDPGLAALISRKRNEQQASLFAEKLQSIVKENPDRKIRLVAHSGGAGIATWALERLPKDIRVESIVFIAPALSQKYDLSDALRHVRGKAYVLSSENDGIVLGAGTRLLGTIDGVKEEAAGMRGFTMPEGADEAQYAKLVAMPYTADWMAFDNIGDHIGPMSEIFAEKVISRLLRDLPPPTTRPSNQKSASAAQRAPAK